VIQRIKHHLAVVPRCASTYRLEWSAAGAAGDLRVLRARDAIQAIPLPTRPGLNAFVLLTFGMLVIIDMLDGARHRRVGDLMRHRLRLVRHVVHGVALIPLTLAWLHACCWGGRTMELH
jgi:hypothetical protein